MYNKESSGISKEEVTCKVETAEVADGTQLWTGSRDIVSNSPPSDLSDAERDELGKIVLAMLNNELGKIISSARDVDLEKTSNWWAGVESHGGILLNGSDIWNAQQVGETPGVVVVLRDLKDGGAHLIQYLSADHQRSKSE